MAKLFNIVRPDIAVFGQKDAQQVAVIKKLVNDLHFRIDIVTGPTVREPDGLALSSRNARLDGPGREHALALSRALGEVADGVARGELRTSGRRRGRAGRAAAAWRAARILLRGRSGQHGPGRHDRRRGPARLRAALVGGVRLIDNLPITPTHLDAEAVTLIDRASTAAS